MQPLLKPGLSDPDMARFVEMVAPEAVRLEESRRQFVASLYAVRKDAALRLARKRAIALVVPQETADWVKALLREAEDTEYPRTFTDAMRRSLIRLLLEAPQKAARLSEARSCLHVIDPLIKWAYRQFWYTLTPSRISVTDIWWSMFTDVPFSVPEAYSAEGTAGLQWDLANLAEAVEELNRRIRAIVRPAPEGCSIRYVLVAESTGAVTLGLELANRSSEPIGYLEVRTWIEGIHSYSSAFAFERPWVALNFLNAGAVRWIATAGLRRGETLRIPHALVRSRGLALARSGEWVFRLESSTELSQVVGFPEGLHNHPLCDKLLAWPENEGNSQILPS